MSIRESKPRSYLNRHPEMGGILQRVLRTRMRKESVESAESAFENLRVTRGRGKRINARVPMALDKGTRAHWFVVTWRRGCWSAGALPSVRVQETCACHRHKWRSENANHRLREMNHRQWRG